MKHFILICTIVLLPLPVFAGPPVKSPKCADKISIQAPRGGAGIVFDEKCTTAYVLPPLFGKVELQGISATVGKADCQTLQSLKMSERQIAAKIEAITRLTKITQEERSAGSTIGNPGGLTPPSNPQTPEPIEETPNFAELRAQMNELIGMIEDLRRAVRAIGSVSGATAGLVYTLDHEAMVQAYQKLNGNKIQFQRLQVERGYLSFSPKSPVLKEEGSAVLDYNVPGLSKFPGEDDLGEVAAGSVHFGSAQAGNVTLTGVGACALMNPSTGKFPQDLRASELAKYLAAKVTYSYGLQVYRKYNARYNLANMVSRMESRTSKGGFLQTKTINELIIDKKSEDWFEFSSESEDPRWPNEVLSQQIKAELIDRVLRQITLAQVPGDMQAPPLTEPGKKGSDVAADGVRKCPHIYCQAAAVILDVVGATFGRSTAVSNFKSSQNYWAEDRVNESRAFRFFGDAVFKDSL